MSRKKGSDETNSGNAIVIFDKKSRHLQRFVPGSSSLTKMHQMMHTEVDYWFSAIVYGEYIYIFKQDKEVFRLKHTDERATWEQMESMNEDHGWRPTVVVVGIVFYAIGSHDGHFSNCVEIFDPENNQWTTSDLMLPEATSGSTLLVMQGFIYSFGGLNKNEEYLYNVRRFDPSRPALECKEMTQMREGKRVSAAVEYNGKAYVMGGTGSRKTNLVSVDCYDPEKEQTNSPWTKLKNMTTPRAYFRAFAMDGFIYAVGGTSQASIEKYDISANNWEKIEVPSPVGKEMRIHESVKITN